MKSNPSETTSFLQSSIHDKESQLCFGAAALCLVIGLVGISLNNLFSFSSSIDALLVISVFYGMLGTVRVAQLRKEYAAEQVTAQTVQAEAELRTRIKSAA